MTNGQEAGLNKIFDNLMVQHINQSRVARATPSPVDNNIRGNRSLSAAATNTLAGAYPVSSAGGMARHPPVDSSSETVDDSKVKLKATVNPKIKVVINSPPQPFTQHPQSQPLPPPSFPYPLQQVPQGFNMVSTHGGGQSQQPPMFVLSTAPPSQRDGGEMQPHVHYHIHKDKKKHSHGHHPHHRMGHGNHHMITHTHGHVKHSNTLTVKGVAMTVFTTGAIALALLFLFSKRMQKWARREICKLAANACASADKYVGDGDDDKDIDSGDKKGFAVRFNLGEAEDGKDGDTEVGQSQHALLTLPGSASATDNDNVSRDPLAPPLSAPASSIIVDHSAEMHQRPPTPVIVAPIIVAVPGRENSDRKPVQMVAARRHTRVPGAPVLPCCDSDVHPHVHDHRQPYYPHHHPAWESVNI